MGFASLRGVARVSFCVIFRMGGAIAVLTDTNRGPGAGLAAVSRAQRAGASANAGCRSSGARRRTSSGRSPVRGRGWSSPVVSGGRVWLTTSVDATAAPRSARWPSMWRPDESRERGGVPPLARRSSTTRRTATPRRRPSSTAIACTCTSAPTEPRRCTTAGEVGLDDAVSVRVAARRRRLADAPRGSADFQLRRPR